MEPKQKQISLRAKGIYKSFYNPAYVPILKGLDLTVFQGETVAIMGRSGEGKSTLLNVLGTLDNPCQGELEIAGQVVTRFNKNKIRKQNIAFIFQSFHLLEDYTVIENVLMPAKISRQDTSPGSSAYRQANTLLDHVGLSERKDFSVKLLSGGEKQRVAIARAMSNNPDILFADEPSGNLDRQTAISIHALLLDFCKKKNKTLIVVTHDQTLANLCDKQYWLQEGILSSKKLANHCSSAT